MTHLDHFQFAGSVSRTRATLARIDQGIARRRAILAALAEAPASAHDLAPRIGCSDEQTRKHVRRLVRCGAIVVTREAVAGTGIPALYGLPPA
jgi:predicted ArsR family transcriptional regulator